MVNQMTHKRKLRFDSNSQELWILKNIKLALILSEISQAI